MAAITITILDVVVYLPIALISGIAGQFIRPFAVLASLHVEPAVELCDRAPVCSSGVKRRSISLAGIR